MAADVLMGNDPDCGRWILAHREPTPEGEVSRRRVNRRPSARPAEAGPCAAAAADPPTTAAARHLHAVRAARPVRRRDDRPRRRPLARRRHRLGLRRAAASAAAARSSRRSATFPKHGITSSPDHLAPPGAREAEYDRKQGLAEGRRLSCAAHLLGDMVIDVPPDSQVHRQVVRKGLPVRDFTIDPVVRLHYVEVDAARARLAVAATWSGSSTPSSASGTSTDLEADLDVIRALQPALEAGGYAVTVAVHRRPPRDGGLARAPRGRLRRRDRRRLDHDRRPPREPGGRRRPGLPRRHEPADPVRRGPDEPRLVRDDASRGSGAR